jgi:hypothetical protein
MGSERLILLSPLYERRDAIASITDSAILFDAFQQRKGCSHKRISIFSHSLYETVGLCREGIVDTNFYSISCNF